MQAAEEIQNTDLPGRQDSREGVCAGAEGSIRLFIDGDPVREKKRLPSCNRWPTNRR